MEQNIPKIIYYCWFGGEKPQKVLDCINNWKNKLSNYEIIEINEYNKELFDVEKECQNNKWFKTIWEHKLWAYISDYARLKILYKNGGVYFDTDITVEKDITDLLNKNKLILGWEDMNKINGSVIITYKKNPLIKEMFDFYKENIWNSNLYTIPEIITHVLTKHYELKSADKISENDKILIFPTEYFYPIPYVAQNKNKENYVTQNTYTIHWWEASWLKPNICYFLKNKYKVELNKLLKQCFEKQKIFENKFLIIEKQLKEIFIKIDFEYALRFKNKYYDDYKLLTLFILGIQIPLYKKRYTKLK